MLAEPLPRGPSSRGSVGARLRAIPGSWTCARSPASGAPTGYAKRVPPGTADGAMQRVSTALRKRGQEMASGGPHPRARPCASDLEVWRRPVVKVAPSTLHPSLALRERAGVRETVMAAATYFVP